MADSAGVSRRKLLTEPGLDDPQHRRPRMLLAKPEVTIRPVKRLLRDVSPITVAAGKRRRLLTCDPTVDLATPCAPMRSVLIPANAPRGLVWDPANDVAAPGVVASRKPGLEVLTPPQASTTRATKRRKSASLTEQGDAITALPGRTRLETLKV